MKTKLGRFACAAFMAGAAFSGRAFGADLPELRQTLEPAPAEASDYNWTGAYAVGYVGYQSTTSTATELGAQVPDNPANCAPAGTAGVPAGMYWCNVNGSAKYTSTPTLSYNQVGNRWSMRTQGITAGFGLGYLHQDPGSHFVYGAEADFDYIGNQGISGLAPLTDDTRMGIGASSYGTARLIAGYAKDRWLAYATGGAAFGSFNNWIQDQDTPVGIRTTPTALQWGFALGAGGAYALSDHWVIKAEYLYLDFPGAKTTGYANLTCGYDGADAGVCSAAGAGYWKTTPLSNPPTGAYSWKVGQKMNVVRMGVAYKF